MTDATAQYIYIYIYLDTHLCKLIARNPKQQYYHRRLTKFSPFPVFFAVSDSFFFSFDFFRRFVGFVRRFKTGKHMQNDKHAKSVRRQKEMPPAIIPEKAIILHTLEDGGIYCVVAMSTHWLTVTKPLFMVHPWAMLRASGRPKSLASEGTSLAQMAEGTPYHGMLLKWNQMDT